MRRLTCTVLLGLLGLLLPAVGATAADDARPNIVLIYVDDLGYGDLSCYGATKLTTPRIDQLARQGRRFTDAHAASAVCTPSRYALLSGRYPWRADLWSPVFLQSPLVLPQETYTLADLCRSRGYATACIGKWHLGFGEGGPPDWNADLKPGPLELGFDHYFGVPVVNSHPPFVYVENHRVVGLDPADPLVVAPGAVSPSKPYPRKHTRPQNRNAMGIRGGKAAHDLYIDEEIGTTLTQKAVTWIAEHRQQPFLLYLGTTGIHHPITPHPRLAGTSGCGPYGDFVHEIDWMVGQVLDALDEHGLAQNTLVIFTSDNGGMLHDEGLAAWNAGHRLNGPMFGFKFDAWEGGHRVPLIVRWPGKVPAGTTSDHLVSSIDFLRTLAAVMNVELPADAAPDSFNILPELTDDPAQPVRDHLLVAAQRRTHLALREAQWLYLPAQAGGGFGNGLTAIRQTGQTTSDITADGPIRPDAPPEQLFNLGPGGSQTQNIVTQRPDVAARLRDRMEQLRAGSRTAPR